MFNSRRHYLELIKEFYDKSCKKKYLLTKPDYWPVIKIQLGFLCHFSYGGNKINYSSFKKFSKFSFSKLLSLTKEKINIWILSFKYNNILKGKILLVSFANNQSVSGIDPYIHPIKKILDENEIKNEIIVLNNFEREENGNALNTLFYRLRSFYEYAFYFKKNNKLIAVYDKLTNEIKDNFFFERFGDISIDDTCRNVISACIQNLIYQKVFFRFLKITKPEIIWTYCFYDNRILSLNFAANKLKIPVIEYQHSTQGDDHFAYSKWENIDSLKNYFPSAFWVWRKSDAEMIRKNFYGHIYQPKIITGGNIFLALEKSNLDQLKKDPDRAKGILVSLQGMWIPTFVEEAVSKLTDFTWYFRLHPRYPNDKFKLEQLKLKFPDRIEIKEANELSLYQLFEKVRFNLTSFSGTAIESQAFEVKNVIISEEGKSAYKNMIDNDAFLYASNFSELESILNNDHLQVNFEYDQMETDIQNVKKYIFQVTDMLTHDRAINN